MASASMVTAFLSLVCAAWTLLSDWVVAAYSPMIRLVGLAFALITMFLLVSSIRQESPRPANRSPGDRSRWWSSKPGRLGLWLVMVAFILIAAYALKRYRVNLDAVSHTAGAATATLLFTWIVLRRRRSRPT